jgi:UDP-glucuronate 4-epimerase
VRFLVTGTAGFIGFHVAKRLIDAGHDVVGIDGMTPYYDVALKRRRHAILLQSAHFSAQELMLEDAESLRASTPGFVPTWSFISPRRPGCATAWRIRAPISAPTSSARSISSSSRATRRPQHLLLASTSSVYGANTKMPFEESDRTDHPLTLYAATKTATESMAHAYAHLWKIPTTVFRFFSVYGPWGRPDMALFKFTKAIPRRRADRRVQLRTDGSRFHLCRRHRERHHTPGRRRSGHPTPAHDTDDDLGLSPAAPFRVVNIGNGDPVGLLTFIEAIEASTGRPAIRNYLPMQPGDVPATFADTSLLRRLTGFQPATPVSTGVKRFVAWYRDYHRV